MSKLTQVLDDYRQFKSEVGSSICLGNFDGIHLAHQKILKSCLDNAKRRNLASVIFTFEPHPARVIRPEHAPARMMTREEKREFLCSLGFDYLVEQTFDSSFMSLSAEDFVDSVLIKQLKANFIVVGPHLRFGFKGLGDIALLRGRANACEVEQIESLELAGDRLSSSRIRNLIEAGDLEAANFLLGHPFFVSGKVVRGAGRGAGIGFATTNLETPRELLPAVGVYASICQDRKTGFFFAAATNCGRNPTFKANGELSIESHWIDFVGDVYEREIRIFFLKRIRSEKKFDDVSGLKSQILQDVRETRNFFHSQNLMRGESIKNALSLTHVDLLTQNFQPFGSLKSFS